MKDTDYAGINAQIRVFETRLIKASDFEAMLEAPSFSEAIQLLKDSAYQEAAERMKGHEGVETLLLAELKSAHQEIAKIVPEPRLVELFSLQYTYHNIKVLLKAKLTQQNFDSLLMGGFTESLAAIRQAVTVGKAPAVDSLILSAIQEAEVHYQEYGLVQGLDIILDRFYFQQLKQLALTIGEAEIIRFVEIFIDFNNLSTLARGIQQQRTSNFLRTVLSSHGSLAKEQLVQLASEDLVSLPLRLKEQLPTSYQALIEASIEVETASLAPVTLELTLDNALMTYCQEAKLKAFGPLPTVAYLYAKQTEIANIRLILAGKLNHISNEKLKERMRQSYDL